MHILMRHLSLGLAAALILSVSGLSGCAGKNASTKAEIERQGEKLQEISRSRAYDVLEESYIGARPIPIGADDTTLGMRVTLRKKGTLASMAAAIQDMTNLTAHVSAVAPEPLKGASNSPSSLGAAPLPDLSPLSNIEEPLRVFSVSYEGPLRGLLDHLSTLSGFGWDYDAKKQCIVFARLMVRTFTLLAAPGTVSYENQITNKSKESAASNLGSMRGVNQPMQQSDTSAQTSQTNKMQFQFDVWEETEKTVKSLLSKEGSVVGNQAAGTITVRDKHENIRQIAVFIGDTNTRLSRQVALNVRVWALELTDKSEAGLDLQAIFKTGDISVVAGKLAGLGGLNTATATIVSGQLKDSEGVLKALKQWGRATQVTSGGGLVMSNQPVPVLAIKKDGYLAGTSMSQSEYGQTTEITPGEVTTGFAMTVIPHILEGRKVILQYNIDLSSLDKLQEFKIKDVIVQVPKTSKRAFFQRTRMQMGQTLVLAGFQQETQGVNNGIGLFNASRSGEYGKTILVITIEVESADMGGIEA